MSKPHEEGFRGRYGGRCFYLTPFLVYLMFYSPPSWSQYRVFFTVRITELVEAVLVL